MSKIKRIQQENENCEGLNLGAPLIAVLTRQAKMDGAKFDFKSFEVQISKSGNISDTFVEFPLQGT
jgi:hypothetical protein